MFLSDSDLPEVYVIPLGPGWSIFRKEDTVLLLKERERSCGAMIDPATERTRRKRLKFISHTTKNQVRFVGRLLPAGRMIRRILVRAMRVFFEIVTR
jgi:hypothetical protein